MIRKAESNDIPEILELQNEFLTACGSKALFGSDYPSMKLYLNLLIQAESNAIVLIDSDYRGYFLGTIEPVSVNITKRVLLEQQWYVKPSARGTGLGHKLMQAAIKLAKKEGAEFIISGHHAEFAKESLENYFIKNYFKPLETLYYAKI